MRAFSRYFYFKFSGCYNESRNELLKKKRFFGSRKKNISPIGSKQTLVKIVFRILRCKKNLKRKKSPHPISDNIQLFRGKVVGLWPIVPSFQISLKNSEVNRPFARGSHFTTATRILQGVAFLCKLHCTKKLIYIKFTQCKFGAKKCKLSLNKK